MDSKINFILHIVNECKHKYMINVFKERLVADGVFGSKKTIKRFFEDVENLNFESRRLKNFIKPGDIEKLSLFKSRSEKSILSFIDFLKQNENFLNNILLIQYELYCFFVLINKYRDNDEIFHDCHINELIDIFSKEDLKKITDIITSDEKSYNRLFKYQKKIVAYLFKKASLYSEINVFDQFEIEFDFEGFYSDKERKRIKNAEVLMNYNIFAELTPGKTEEERREMYLIYSFAYCLERLRRKFLH